MTQASPHAICADGHDSPVAWPRIILWPRLRWRWFPETDANAERFAVVSFRWALLVSPKSEDDSSKGGARHHVSNKLLLRGGALRATWEYEKLAVTGSSSATPYVRVLVGKIKKSQAQFEASVEKAEILQDVSTYNYPCRLARASAIAVEAAGDPGMANGMLYRTPNGRIAHG